MRRDISDVEMFLHEKHIDFWYDIYNVEKDELRNLKKYIEYVTKTLRNYQPFSTDYNGIKELFLKKHLDYLQEALACLLSANYNALACLLRIMIENYVCFSLIKKYKKYDLWKDWYIHGCYKALRIAAGEPYHSKTEKVYKSICDDLNLPYDYIKDKGSYGWVRRAIKLKRYTFKSVCALIDENIYKDFEWLS